MVFLYSCSSGDRMSVTENGVECACLGLRDIAVSPPKARALASTAAATLVVVVVVECKSTSRVPLRVSTPASLDLAEAI